MRTESEVWQTAAAGWNGGVAEWRVVETANGSAKAAGKEAAAAARKILQQPAAMGTTELLTLIAHAEEAARLATSLPELPPQLQKQAAKFTACMPVLPNLKIPGTPRSAGSGGGSPNDLSVKTLSDSAFDSDEEEWLTPKTEFPEETWPGIDIQTRAGETTNEAIVRTLDAAWPGPKTPNMGTNGAFDGPLGYDMLTEITANCVFRQPWDRLVLTYLYRIHTGLAPDLHGAISIEDS